MEDSKEIQKLLLEIPKSQVNEFKGESEHSESESLRNPIPLTEPNDSPFRIRRLSRSFSIPNHRPERDEGEEILVSESDENRSSPQNDTNFSKSKSKFILLKRSRSLGNIFLPDQIKMTFTEVKAIENLTEKFEALEIEVLSTGEELENQKSVVGEEAEILNVDKSDNDYLIKTEEVLTRIISSSCPLIDRPQTSPPVLYPSSSRTRTKSASSDKLTIFDRMQKSINFLFRCTRKEEGNSSSEEETIRKDKYPTRSRTPDAKFSKRPDSIAKTKTITMTTKLSRPDSHQSVPIPMQTIHNFVTKVDEAPSCGEIVSKFPHFIDIPGPKGPLLQPCHVSNEGKKCLVLDLDETLVHSSFHVPEAHDLVVSLGLPDGSNQNIYVAKRPGVDEFLARVSEDFEVVIFTASLAHYADPVIDFLTIGMNRFLKAPREINLRLYRESCLFLRGLYVKDLSRLGRKLEHTVIVDNSPASFLLQPDHGIPIKSWFSDVKDRELPLLQESLGYLVDAENVIEWKSIIVNLT